MTGRSSVVVESFSTAGLASRDRTDFWIDLVSTYHGATSWAGPRHNGFNGNLLRASTSTHQLIGWRSNRVGYRRTASHVRENTDEDYRVVIPTGGHVMLRQGHRASALPQGYAGLMTTSEPYTLTQSPASGFALVIPRQAVDDRLNVSAPLAGRLNLGTGLGRIVGGLIATLFHECETLTSAQFDSVNDRVIDLLCLLAVGDVGPNASRHLADVENMVRQHVRRHVSDPDLSGHSIARDLGWSLRQVQLALQHAGTTPSELIKDERLKLARYRLESPTYHHLSITEIAYDLGFCSPSAFSTAFKQHFGVRPSSIRQ